MLLSYVYNTSPSQLPTQGTTAVAHPRAVYLFVFFLFRYAHTFYHAVILTLDHKYVRPRNCTPRRVFPSHSVSALFENTLIDFIMHFTTYNSIGTPIQWEQLLRDKSIYENNV